MQSRTQTTFGERQKVLSGNVTTFFFWFRSALSRYRNNHDITSSYYRSRVHIIYELASCRVQIRDVFGYGRQILSLTVLDSAR